MKIAAHALGLLATFLLGAMPPLASAQSSRLLVPNTLHGLNYPAELLARGQGGTVLVQLRIDEKGDVAELIDVQATAGPAELEAAVRRAVRRWTFRRHVVRECKAEAVEGVAQIEFAVKDGKPVITARGRPDVEGQVAAYRPKPSNTSLMELMQAGYPLRARKAQLGAVVTADVDVEAASGIPVAVRISSIAFSKSPGYAEATTELTEAARSALMRNRFDSKIGKGGDLYQFCVNLQYTPSPDDD